MFQIKEPYKVLIVDDSAVVRGFTTKILESDPEIKVVSAAANGEDGVKKCQRFMPEVVILDIEMPVMDGLEAIPELLKINPKVKIVMSSTLTLHNAEVSLKALDLGAIDYISKPTSMVKDKTVTSEFSHILIEKVKQYGAMYRGIEKEKFRSDFQSVRQSPSFSKVASISKQVTTPTKIIPHAIAIGSSTGGPPALLKLLADILPEVTLPIFITQHMPPAFTEILARNISKNVGCECHEGRDGEEVLKKHVYIAPGDYHMRIVSSGTRKIIRLNQSEPENFCRPAVDPMFRSLNTAYNGLVLGVILTGMGQDGLFGSADLVKGGGRLIAQDEDSSVVWGMPGAVANANLCESVLPIDDMGNYIKRIVKGIL